MIYPIDWGEFSEDTGTVVIAKSREKMVTTRQQEWDQWVYGVFYWYTADGSYHPGIVTWGW